MGLWGTPMSYIIWAALTAIVLAGSACTSDPVSTSEPTNTSEPSSTSERSTSSTQSGPGELAVLPIREGPLRETSQSVPHIQLDAAPVPAVDAELRRRAFAIPTVEDMPSAVSVAGARGLWFDDELELARPEILASGREFAHIHPDGSLHLWLPSDRAAEVASAKWGELHPWVDRDGFWDGVVMVFTPESLDEVDVVIRLIVESYNFVAGANLDPDAY